uniref:Lipocalin n=1 Tax=Rhipicephalus appendiculatus TaxID=34631 RepID=A0A131YJL5_RHIAP
MLLVCVVALFLSSIWGDGEAYGQIKGTHKSTGMFEDNKCASGNMSGWEWFLGKKKQVLLKRTYNITGNPNDSICVQGKFRPIVYQNNTMEKTFTYRNLSSPHVLKGTGVRPWPIAKFSLNFYAVSNGPASPRRSLKLNYVNSSLLHSAYGYHLPKPEWIFQYCDDDCAVMNVPSKDPGGADTKKCELWVRMDSGKTPNITHWSDDNPCVKYFSTYCYTQHPTEVYIPRLCEL